MAEEKPKWTKQNEKELFELKFNLRKKRNQLRNQSNSITEDYPIAFSSDDKDDRYEILKKQKLDILSRCDINTLLSQVNDEMIVQNNYMEAYNERQEKLHQSTLSNMDVEQAAALHSKFIEERQMDQIYKNQLNELNKNIQSSYKLCDLVVYCRHKIVPEELPDKKLPNEDAIKLFNYAHMLNLVLENRLEKDCIDDILIYVDNDTDRKELLSLYNVLCYRQDLCLILYTVLTITTLSDEDRKTFRKELNDIKALCTSNEDRYIFKHFVSTRKHEPVDYADENVAESIEKDELLFMGMKSTKIIDFLQAVTVLHFQRPTHCSVLTRAINFFGWHSQTGEHPVIDKAVEILRSQPIDRRELRPVSPLSSIGLVGDTLPTFERGEKHWYKYQKYLYIEGSSEVNSPVYIARSEISRLIQAITEQFRFDNTGLYEEERTHDLLNQSLSSVIVYVANDRQNVKKISGKLECGGEKIIIGHDLYITNKSYAELKKRTFDRLCSNTKKYANWFREILKGRGNIIRFEDDIDRDICVLAHAKIISESVRNVTTWMINLMCLDLIEKGVVLQEKSEGMSTQSLSPLLIGAWNLFFDYHPMRGGSDTLHNIKEVKKDELPIVMNWLCNFWPGNETTSMRNKIDDDYCQNSRIEIQYGDQYYRNIVFHMLYYRMNSNVRWDGNFDLQNCDTGCRWSDDRRGRRILGRIYFDNQSLLSDTDEEGNTDCARLNFLIGADRNELRYLSIMRIQKKIDQNEQPQLNSFYTGKIRQLEQEISKEVAIMNAGGGSLKTSD